MKHSYRFIVGRISFSWGIHSVHRVPLTCTGRVLWRHSIDVVRYSASSATQAPVCCVHRRLFVTRSLVNALVKHLKSLKVFVTVETSRDIVVGRCTSSPTKHPLKSASWPWRQFVSGHHYPASLPKPPTNPLHVQKSTLWLFSFLPDVFRSCGGCFAGGLFPMYIYLTNPVHEGFISDIILFAIL